MYTKLFSSITDSTIWREEDHTRLVWITMLAMADKYGHVAASVPGLADRARVPIEKTVQALEVLAAPDEWSRSKESDGRRIEEQDGGWVIINYTKYAKIRDEEERKEYMRNYMRKRRKQVVSNVSSVNPSKPGLAHTDADTINTTPPTPLSGGLTTRQVKNIQTEMQRIAAAMVGAHYSLEDALARACAKVGVEFEKAKYLLGESA